ncbi:MAG: hypothetical protein WKF92_04955 [Pyrinomonadaceae bacterium]
MNSFIAKFLKIAFVSCLVLSAAGLAAGQQTAFGADGPAEKEFYRLTDAAPAAFKAGDIEKAKRLADALLVQAETLRENWNYGNAVHAAHLVFGHAAFAEGKIDDAKNFLILAGNIPGSPQLKSFGPDMTLAKKLLEKNERETVIKYFDLCAKFWDPKHAKLVEWKAEVLKGDTPDFGANLRYRGF